MFISAFTEIQFVLFSNNRELKPGCLFLSCVNACSCPSLQQATVLLHKLADTVYSLIHIDAFTPAVLLCVALMAPVNCSLVLFVFPQPQHKDHIMAGSPM